MKLPFKTNSELAAKEERKKNYLSAYVLWKKASKLTGKEINKHLVHKPCGMVPKNAPRRSET